MRVLLLTCMPYDVCNDRGSSVFSGSIYFPATYFRSGRAPYPQSRRNIVLFFEISTFSE